MEQRKSRMDLRYSSKRRKKNNNIDLIDRISALPDSISGLILSFLSTKNAVATSILSKRWKFAWVAIHNLDFHYSDLSKAHIEGSGMKFVEFVNRVLLPRDAGLLKKFKLLCDPDFSSSHINSWISTAITRNVHELSLLLFRRRFDMPTSVFSCGSLQSIRMIGDIVITSISDGFEFCLPRLERLVIFYVYFESEEACEKLISGCPKLNHLHLNISNDDFKCIITSVSLRRLDIYFKNKSSLKLKACSLECLKLAGNISEIFVQKGLSSMVEAYIQIFRHNDFISDSIVESVRAFDCARILNLSADVMETLSCSTISLSTKFTRLVKLVATCLSRSLRDFIQSSDNLEVLIIHQHTYRHDRPNWTAFVEVPRCLSNNLKKVEFNGYNGTENERELIRFMLKHGGALEIMQISCNSDTDGKMFDLVQEICEFPIKSPACKVRLYGFTSKRKFKPLS